MDIEDLLADLENNNTTIHGRTTLLNNTSISSNNNNLSGNRKSLENLTGEESRGISTGVTTHLVSETDQSFAAPNVSHISNGDDKVIPFLTKSEKNQLDIQAFMELTTSWRNERMSPELLPFNEPAFNVVTDNMKAQIEYIDYWNMMQESEVEMEATNDKKSNEQLLIQKRINKLPLYCMEAELERVKFLIRSYLRCRLQKIDTFLLLLEGNDQMIFDETNLEEKSIFIINKLLSESEYKYFKQKVKIVVRLYSNTVLLNLPENFQQMNDESSNVKMIQEPDLEKFVFIFVKGSGKQNNSNEKYNIFNRETQEEVELVVGGIYVMRYDLVEAFIKEGVIILI
ncbi:Sld5-domain-containing protein [Hanseniaspora valbyensis NRRL Y-1626]|uniref:DNA replication complex GINS protein SLD5 n=1 Tax=Hanseniaspora valbyensis NRRL Y-1626 TaxID=766949 RepID=A0A1B7TG53_9ASCO|nr:Sld5-domain-containing protein [Hanseniaspora valbyensis NRRL Y-1626]